jgi:hypothetical protein
MKCERARELLVTHAEGLPRVALWIHLRFCPRCRAEAAEIRALGTALDRLPRYAAPRSLLPSLLALVPTTEAVKTRRRRKITMTRLAYVLTLVIAVALLLGGILYKPAPPDGRALLISAAQAMDEVDTIHVHGYSLTFITRPWGAMGMKGSYDHWLSSEGIRRQWFDHDGDLTWSTYTDVQAGLRWQYRPSRRLIWRVPMEVDEARRSAAKSMQRYLDGQIMIDENVEQMGFELIATRRERREGTQVYVVAVDTGAGSREYDIETSTGRLLAFRDYGAPESGRPLLGETHFEYGGALPEGILDFEVPEGWTVKEGVPGEDIAQDDPILLAAWERLAHANDVRLDAEMGKAPWSEAEQAYLSVLDPEGLLAYSEPWVEASDMLGRMYVRWGHHQDALDILSYPWAMGGWPGLVRAWCFDALEKRSEAVRIYRKLERGHGSRAEWGALGLEQPTSPGPLEITAEPGELLLSPGPGWRASAHRSPDPFRPEAAIDGERAVRWAANASEDGPGQEPGDWFELDFGEPTQVTRIVLDHQGSMCPYVSDWPRGIEARFTDDGRTWRSAQVSPAGPMRPATVTFDWPQKVRAIRFELTSTHSPEWWSIHEIYVFAPTS